MLVIVGDTCISETFYPLTSVNIIKHEKSMIGNSAILTLKTNYSRIFNNAITGNYPKIRALIKDIMRDTNVVYNGMTFI